MAKEILLVPRKPVQLKPTDGQFILLDGTVPDALKTPHVQAEEGPLTGLESGWRSAITEVDGEWFKLKGSRPTPGKRSRSPRGTQKLSVAQIEVDTTMARREMFKREGFPYPLHPRGLWAYDYEFEGEKTAAALYKIDGDTRLDELLWWLEKAPLEYISQEERDQLKLLVGMIAQTSGQMLRVMHDNGHTWDSEGSDAYNAHTGNTIIFPVDGKVKAAIADFDNSLDFHPHDEEGLLAVAEQVKEKDVDIYGGDLEEHVAHSTPERRQWNPYNVPISLANGVVGEAFPNASFDDQEAVRVYMLHHIGKLGDWNREEFREAFDKGYKEKDAPLAEVAWEPEKVQGAMRYMDDFIKLGKEFLQQPRRKLLREARQYAFLADYKHPIVTPNNKIDSRPPKKIVKDEADPESTYEKIMSLRLILEGYQNSAPTHARDFFSVQRLSRHRFQQIKEFSYGDLSNIVGLWLDGTLQAQFAEYNPRATGAFLLGIAQTRPYEFAEAVSEKLPHVDHPYFMDVMVRGAELLDLIPKRAQRDKSIHDHLLALKVKKLIPESITEDGLETEIETRAGLNLYKHGILTDAMQAVWRRPNYMVLSSQFTAEHVPALRATYQVFENYPHENVQYNGKLMVNLALTGISAREGAQDMDHWMGPRDERSTTQFKYYYSAYAKDQITHPDLQKVMAEPSHEHALISFSMYLMVMKQPLHPDSYFAEDLRKATIDLNQSAALMKVAIDETHGDLSQIDPTLMAAIERDHYEGDLNQELASQLAMACVGFELDIPEFVKRGITSENEKMFANIFRSDGVHRGENIYENQHPPYPYHPVYEVMTRGFEGLPPTLREIAERNADDMDFINEWTVQVIKHLSGNGFYAQYFGAWITGDGYPPPVVQPRDLFDNNPKHWPIWKLVHPDIWRIVEKSTPDVLRSSVRTRFPDNKVQIQLSKQDAAHVATRTVSLAEMFPPEIYEQIKDLAV